MLNEKKEYEEYTCQITSTMAKRFFFPCTQKDSGIEIGLKRALTILARHALFSETMPLSPEQTIHFLDVWCGFKEAENLPKEYTLLSGWFPDYVLEFAKSAELKKREYLEKRLQDFLRIKKKSYHDALFPVENSSYNTNDQNKIYFEKIIADASVHGALKRHIMVSRVNPTEDIKKITGKKTGVPTSDQKKMILKSFAYILSQQREEQRFILFNRGNLANWIGGKAPKDVPYKGGLETMPFIYKKEDNLLFEVKVVREEFPRLVALNQEFVRDYDLKVLSEDDILDWLKESREHEEYLFYMDLGTGRDLFVGKALAFYDRSYDEIEAEAGK